LLLVIKGGVLSTVALELATNAIRGFVVKRAYPLADGVERAPRVLQRRIDWAPQYIILSLRIVQSSGKCLICPAYNFGAE
jgi:hypothetical protein